MILASLFFFFSSRRRHTRLQGDWSSDVCSSDLEKEIAMAVAAVYKQKDVRPMIAVIFGLFFLMNILLFVLALLAAIKGGKAPQILPADLGGGVRLLIFILGLGAS